MAVTNTEATPAAADPYRPPAGSLDEAAMRFDSLLFPKEEEQPASESQPEQSSPTAETAEQAQPAATKADEAEAREAAASTESESTDEDSAQQEDVFTVRIDGQDVQVPRDELLRGYSRNADYTRKTQTLADQRKAVEEKERALLAERQSYLSLIPELKKLIAESTAEPDWEALARTVTPDVFAERVRVWRDQSAARQKVEAEEARVKALQEEEAKRGFSEMLAREKDLLETALPDMKDPEKGKVLQTQLSDYARRQSFTDEELGQVTDHRLVLLLHKAMLYDKQQAEAPKVQQKIAKALAPAAPGNRQPAPKPNKLAEAKARQRQNGGSLEDTAAAIAALLD